MSLPASPESVDPRITADRYLTLAREGLLQEDDRVELLEGVIVTMVPQDPPHAAGTTRTDSALRRALGDRAAVRVQMPLRLEPHSVPEPDVAVVPGHDADYDHAHPTTALLIVEVAQSSLAQDRITKTRIYAAAAIPETWILNLRDDCVEIFRDPTPELRSYRTTTIARRGDAIIPVAFPDARIAVAELLPARLPA